jgi:hypothetical protein
LSLQNSPEKLPLFHETPGYPFTLAFLPAVAFIGQKGTALVKYLADCPAVVAQIREKKLDVGTQLKKIVRKYNACFDQ